MSKGDQIGVAIRGVNDVFNTVARQNGRTVDYEFETEAKISWVVVRERTRGGTIVTEHRYPADQVLVLVRAVKEV